MKTSYVLSISFSIIISAVVVSYFIYFRKPLLSKEPEVSKELVVSKEPEVSKELVVSKEPVPTPAPKPSPTPSPTPTLASSGYCTRFCSGKSVRSKSIADRCTTNCSKEKCPGCSYFGPWEAPVPPPKPF